MDRALFKRIIEQAVQSGTTEFAWLHLFGEPLMNPAFPEFAKHAHAQGLRVGVSTNCTLLRGRMTEELARTPLTMLLLSIDGITANRYEAVRVGADFDAVVSNVLAFGALYLDADPITRPVHVVLSTIDLPGFSDADETAAVEFWRARLPASFIIHRKGLTTWAEQETVSVDRVLRRIGVAQPKRRRNKGCQEFSSGLTVLADGRVVPCNLDHDGTLIVGDLRTQSLAEVWSGPVMQRLREDHVLDNDLCRYCQVYVNELDGPHSPWDVVRATYGLA